MNADSNQQHDLLYTNQQCVLLNKKIYDLEFLRAIKVQTKFMVNLVLSNNIDITNNMILIALHTYDWYMLEIISNHLNTNKKYYGKFCLKSQELSYILKMDNINLIKNFQYFIEADTACYVLNIAMNRMEGVNCLKKILVLKIIKRPYHLYFLLKVANDKNVYYNILGKYVTKRMVDYAISDNNSKILNFILSALFKKIGMSSLNKVIQRYLKKCSRECHQILNKYNMIIRNHKIETIRV
jgi:hypothetical protein